MKLEALKVVGLHGHISHKVSFHNDLTLLVGINGSGKTSILNAIDWLLRFDIKHLCSVSFELIELTYTGSHKQRFTLRATQDSKQLKLELVGAREPMKPVLVDFLVHPSEIDDSVDREALVEHYGQLGPERHERALWSFLRKVEKPVVITLDRALSAEVGNDAVFVEDVRLGRARRVRATATTPISKVKQVTTERHARYSARAAELNEQLKTKIVMSAFRTPLDPSTRSDKGGRPLTIDEVSRLQKKVTDLVSPSTKGEQESSQIATYFGQAKKYLKGGRMTPKDLDLFAAQFRQIEALADAFDDFDRESADEYEPLKLYLTSVNRFFTDSGKRLAFVPSSNALIFQELGESPPTTIQSGRNIAHLSSGERQILVLFTFLAFIATEDSVFIIDEPELSLHPKWQLEFLRAFLELKPRGTQLVLATHSPEIVAEHKRHCFVLDAARSQA